MISSSGDNEVERNRGANDRTVFGGLARVRQPPLGVTGSNYLVSSCKFRKWKLQDWIFHPISGSSETRTRVFASRLCGIRKRTRWRSGVMRSSSMASNRRRPVSDKDIAFYRGGFFFLLCARIFLGNDRKALLFSFLFEAHQQRRARRRRRWSCGRTRRSFT